MSTDCAVCYVSSKEYLLPSIISAAGIRRHVPEHKADVFIFLTSTDQTLIADVNQKLAERRIVVRGFDAGTIKEINNQAFEGYITATTLGRFFIGSLIPSSCRRLVYVDGDTWIRRDPSKLIDAEVPEGKIAAAEDIISFRANSVTRAGRRIQSYFNGLNVSRERGYFNSGVFAVSTRTWSDLAQEAFLFFKTNRHLCNCLDQSALNAVANGRRLPLSLKWNFQSPARFMGIEDFVDPTIYHFNQYIKPWMAVCKPWEDMFQPYMAAVRPFTSMGLSLPAVSQDDIRQHNKLNPVKNFLLKSKWLAKLASLPMDVRAYERAAWL